MLMLMRQVTGSRDVFKMPMKTMLKRIFEECFGRCFVALVGHFITSFSHG